MTQRDRWCHHVGPAKAIVECGGERHTIAWRRGKLVLEDHDLGAEQTMLGFGGEMPACLKTLQMWRNLHSWAMATDLFGQMRARMGDDAILGPGELAGAHQLGLALTWERAWRKGSFYTDHGRLLADHLRAAATAPVREHLRYWVRQRGSRRLSSVQLLVARSVAGVGVTGEMDSVGVRATVTLGARWLVEVWARGLAVVDGGLVLAVEEASGGGGDLDVRAVRWDPDAGQPGRFSPVAAAARVTSTPDGWRLAWVPGPA